MFIYPVHAYHLPNTLWEPVSNLLLSTFDRVRSVAYVSSNFNAARNINLDEQLYECNTIYSFHKIHSCIYNTYQKSPRMVPQALSEGMVAPSILRPSLTTPAPSQTMAPTHKTDHVLHFHKS